MMMYVVNLTYIGSLFHSMFIIRLSNEILQKREFVFLIQVIMLKARPCLCSHITNVRAIIGEVRM